VIDIFIRNAEEVGDCVDRQLRFVILYLKDAKQVADYVRCGYLMPIWQAALLLVSSGGLSPEATQQSRLLGRLGSWQRMLGLVLGYEGCGRLGKVVAAMAKQRS
jgi:hypothetical protein